MARDKGHLTDLQLRHWIKAGKPLAKADGDGLTFTLSAAGLTWGESNMLLITTKCLFTHACGKRLINANPCHGIMLSALLGERPPRRQRLMLSREELKLLLAVPMRHRSALAIRILLATDVRSAELYLALWADVDLDDAQWHIPKSKTGAAMDIPLAPVVVDWFRELKTLAGSSAYVLPAHSRARAARHGGDTHLNMDVLREAIDHWLRTATPAVRRFAPQHAGWSGGDWRGGCGSGDPSGGVADGEGVSAAALKRPRTAHSRKQHENYRLSRRSCARMSEIFNRSRSCCSSSASATSVRSRTSSP